MSNLLLNNLKLFDILNKASDTVIRTPEPSEPCELYSMYILADWLDDAPFNNMVSQEIYKQLSTYLDTIPVIGMYYGNRCIIN